MEKRNFIAVATSSIRHNSKKEWFVIYRIREMLKTQAPTMLRNSVQVDETYVCGKGSNKSENKRVKCEKVNKRRNSDVKTPVIGIVETGGKVVVKVSQYLSKSRTKSLINKFVEIGSIIVTDGYDVYSYLAKMKSLTIPKVNTLTVVLTLTELKTFGAFLNLALLACCTKLALSIYNAIAMSSQHIITADTLKTIKSFI